MLSGDRDTANQPAIQAIIDSAPSGSEVLFEKVAMMTSKDADVADKARRSVARVIRWFGAGALVDVQPSFPNRARIVWPEPTDNEQLRGVGDSQRPALANWYGSRVVALERLAGRLRLDLATRLFHLGDQGAQVALLVDEVLKDIEACRQFFEQCASVVLSESVRTVIAVDSGPEVRLAFPTGILTASGNPVAARASDSRSLLIH